MKKNVRKIINLILLTLILLSILCNSAYADSSESAEGGGSGGTYTGTSGGTTTESSKSIFGKIFDRADTFIDTGTNQDSPIKTNEVYTTSDVLYNVLLGIGICVAFVWGIVLGIKFVTGSLEEKADVKKNVIVYLIGCVLIFGGLGIWQLLVQLLEPLANS